MQALLLATALFLPGCSVSAERVLGADGEPAGSSNASGGTRRAGLPAIGPAPDSSHWHAAYVVRVCDEVLEPFEDLGGSTGLHTHADGLIHVHPYLEEVGFEGATLQRFGEAVGLGLRDGELTLPGGGTWRDGDLCNGVFGRVYVDRWSGPEPTSEIVRHLVDLDQIRFTADGELYHIAFSPVDAPPVVPPTWQQLSEVSSPASLGAETVDPWIRMEAGADPATVALAVVDRVTASPCTDGQLPGAVLSGETNCYSLTDDRFSRADAVQAARAVEFNRQPAVELTITPRLRRFIVEHFAAGGASGSATADGLVLAVIVGDEVVTAPLLVRPSASEDRLVLSGGLSVETARNLADALNG